MQFDYTLYAHPAVARDPFDAASDAEFYRNSALQFLHQNRNRDEGLASLTLTCFGHTDPETLKINYAVSWGYRIPPDHDHLEAMLGVLGDLASKLNPAARMRIAMAVLNNKNTEREPVLADTSQGRPDAQAPDTEPDTQAGPDADPERG